MAQYRCIRTCWIAEDSKAYHEGFFYEFAENPGKHFKIVGKEDKPEEGRKPSSIHGEFVKEDKMPEPDIPEKKPRKPKSIAKESIKVEKDGGTDNISKDMQSGTVEAEAQADN